MANFHQYQYQPIKAPRNIRLMMLAPARSLASPLHCYLVEVCLDESPQYECLSYSCDKQGGSSSILISNLPSQITKNCEAALRRLRYDCKPRALWVDSVCINQNEHAISERNQQILLMREIYRNADEVQVWLGEVDSLSSRGWLKSLSRENMDPWTLNWEDSNDDSALPKDVMGIVLWKTISCLVFAAMEVVKPMILLCTRVSTNKKKSLVGDQNPVFQLFSSAIFERMWCVQEMVMAHNVCFMQGSSTAKWELVIKNLEFLRNMKSTTVAPIYNQCMQRLALQAVLRNIINPSPNQNMKQWPQLSSLLDKTRFLASERPHDKVYSLFGVLTLMGIKLSKPDYAKPVRLVYQEIIIACFSCDQNLDTLYQVTSLPNHHNLQSWVPDLSNTKTPHTLMFQAYHTSRDSPLHWQLSRDACTLWLSGKVIDRISHCGSVLRSPYESQSQQHGPLSSYGETDAAFETFREWLTTAMALTHYPTGEPVDDAFGRLLITDNVVRINKKLSPFLKLHKSWSQILTTSNFRELLLEKGADNMIDDIMSLPVNAHQKQEFALQIATAHLEAVATSPIANGKKVRAFHHWLRLSLRRKVFFVTERGYMGLAPASAQVGDNVMILSGMRTPFLSREGQTKGTFQLVASVYVEGIMNGELWISNEPVYNFGFV